MTMVIFNMTDIIIPKPFKTCLTFAQRNNKNHNYVQPGQTENCRTD